MTMVLGRRIRIQWLARVLSLGLLAGSVCAAGEVVVTTPDIARGLGKKDMVSVKALQVAVSNGLEAQHNSWDGSYFAPDLCDASAASCSRFACAAPGQYTATDEMSTASTITPGSASSMRSA